MTDFLVVCPTSNRGLDSNAMPSSTPASTTAPSIADSAATGSTVARDKEAVPYPVTEGENRETAIA